VVCLCVCVCLSPTEVAEPIEMPFRMWTLGGQSSHLLGVDLNPPREWALLGAMLMPRLAGSRCSQRHLLEPGTVRPQATSSL